MPHIFHAVAARWMGGRSGLNGRYDRGDGVGMERELIVGVGVVCGSFVKFTAAMCCSRPERQHSLKDVGLYRERIRALSDRRDAGRFRQEPAMTQRRARQQGARELPATLPLSNTLLYLR